MSSTIPPTKTSLLSKTRSTLARLYADERGAEGLEKLLIMAAIILPLLGVLIFFKGELGDWVGTQWDNVFGSGQDNDSLPGGGGTP